MNAAKAPPLALSVVAGSPGWSVPAKEVHELVGEIGAGLAFRDLRKPRKRTEREHERLRSIGHRGVTIAARDLLALHRAVHGRLLP